MSSIKEDKPVPNSNLVINMSPDIMAYKLKSCCRLCMDERRSKVSLYETTSRRIQISNAEILQVFTDILADPEDGLPGMICTKCENMLHLILDFKFECQESNDVLVNIYETLNPKMETEMEEDEQEMYVEALEFDDDEQEEANQTTCKTEPEVLGNEEVETKSGNDNFGFEQDPKEELIVIAVENDDDLESTLMKPEVSEESRKKPKRNKNSKCHECGKMVEGPAKLERHMRVHDRERKRQNSQIIKLPKREQSPTPSIFCCDVCKKEFTTASRLKKHLSTHLPMSMRPKSYVCHCGKQYLESNTLRTHQKIAHSNNVSLYACEICKKEFTRKNYRDYHQRLHSSSKPHACELCDFRTAKGHNLVRHMLVHTNEFNFQCDSCGKKFKRKTGLDLHIKTHLCDNQNFMCPHCQRAYPSKKSLLTHLQNVHDVKMSSVEFDQILQETEQQETTITEQIDTDDINLVYAIEDITNDQ